MIPMPSVLSQTFFYELHFNLQDMAWAWGHGEMGMDFIIATTVFRILREKGLVFLLMLRGRVNTH